ncbi:putative Trafficking protein particle complex subunit 3 [Paratrimastix pyriformis]|uniref:Trafficking protein particle complex subunit n=1 Tax=Paratrimastix pyriformis TaxID=342808 RepID=A0ABQ8UDG2_9EUKA|nr:putative Trafficking protein particle complex subunit 3 [Paratrimastix pyriformis]
MANFARSGEMAFLKADKINSEIFSLTYGAMVAQIMKDYEDIEEVNRQLDRMGQNIGSRLIDELFAKTGIPVSSNFMETAEVIAKVGFKMFLGITANVVNPTPQQYSLTFRDNPMVDFVELPDNCANLRYCNLLCGVIRGALEQVQIKVECHFVRDMLRGDETNEIQVRFLEQVRESALDQSFA